GAFPDCGGSCGYELKGRVARAVRPRAVAPGARGWKKKGREAGLPNVLCRPKTPQEGASRHERTSQATRLFPAGTGGRTFHVDGSPICRCAGEGPGANRRLAGRTAGPASLSHAGHAATHAADAVWRRPHVSPSKIPGSADGQDGVLARRSAATAGPKAAESG